MHQQDPVCRSERRSPLTCATSPATLFIVRNNQTYLYGLQQRGSSHIAGIRKVFEYFITTNAMGQIWERSDDITGNVDLPLSKRYVVGLRSIKYSTNFCGGSLIAPSYVFTAAHCISDGGKVWGSVGTSELSETEHLIPVVRTSANIHPKFAKASLVSYDAAIIELAVPALATPVTLDGSVSDFGANALGSILSYTTITNMGFVQYEPHIITLPIWPKARCSSVLTANYDNSMLCAGGQAGVDACAGDLGSPPTIENDKGSDLLIGLVSAGSGCGQEGMPGVYTRAGRLYDFVNSYVPYAKWFNVNPEVRSPTTTTPVENPVVAYNAPAPTPSGKPVPSQVSQSGPRASDTAAVPSSSYITREYRLPALEPLIQSKLMKFILQADANSNIRADSLLARLADGSNSVLLYTTADIRGLQAVLQQHNELPLNQRTDRFKTAAQDATRDAISGRCAKRRLDLLFPSKACKKCLINPRLSNADGLVIRDYKTFANVESGVDSLQLYDVMSSFTGGVYAG